jgi:putative sigma-54 modulation protein
MEIRIQSIHFDASQQLEAFVQKKVSKLEKYLDGILAAEVSLKLIKPEAAMNKEASIKLDVPNQDFFAGKTSDTFEEAIVEAINALEKQLVKYKEKQRAK